MSNKITVKEALKTIKFNTMMANLSLDDYIAVIVNEVKKINKIEKMAKEWQVCESYEANQIANELLEVINDKE